VTEIGADGRRAGRLAMTAAQLGLRRCLAFLPRITQARQFAGTLATTADGAGT
jgi:hypothetical protein